MKVVKINGITIDIHNQQLDATFVTHGSIISGTLYIYLPDVVISYPCLWEEAKKILDQLGIREED